jgi:hypothetical protein
MVDAKKFHHRYHNEMIHQYKLFDWIKHLNIGKWNDKELNIWFVGHKIEDWKVILKSDFFVGVSQIRTVKSSVPVWENWIADEWSFPWDLNGYSVPILISLRDRFCESEVWGNSDQRIDGEFHLFFFHFDEGNVTRKDFSGSIWICDMWYEIMPLRQVRSILYSHIFDDWE